MNQSFTTGVPTQSFTLATTQSARTWTLTHSAIWHPDLASAVSYLRDKVDALNTALEALGNP